MICTRNVGVEMHGLAIALRIFLIAATRATASRTAGTDAIGISLPEFTVKHPDNISTGKGYYADYHNRFH